MKTIFYIFLAIVIYLVLGSITSYAIPNENIKAPITITI